MFLMTVSLIGVCWMEVGMLRGVSNTMSKAELVTGGRGSLWKILAWRTALVCLCLDISSDWLLVTQYMKFASVL